MDARITNKEVLNRIKKEEELIYIKCGKLVYGGHEKSIPIFAVIFKEIKKEDPDEEGSHNYKILELSI